MGVTVGGVITGVGIFSAFFAQALEARTFAPRPVQTFRCAWVEKPFFSQFLFSKKIKKHICPGYYQKV